MRRCGVAESKHRGYPKFYATVMLASYLSDQRSRLAVLDAAAVQLFRDCFRDGSFLPDDQSEIAETLLVGWGNAFFDRNAAALHPIPGEFGTNFQWLQKVLAGEFHINEGWRARGGGYADTVSRQGWKGFGEHLKQAETFLTDAWELRPDWPQAPARMVYVELGQSGAQQMRLWFDRTLLAQADYSSAWHTMRWGAAATLVWEP
jgi:hypothetical protein